MSFVYIEQTYKLTKKLLLFSTIKIYSYFFLSKTKKQNQVYVLLGSLFQLHCDYADRMMEEQGEKKGVEVESSKRRKANEAEKVLLLKRPIFISSLNIPTC